MNAQIKDLMNAIAEAVSARLDKKEAYRKHHDNTDCEGEWDYHGERYAERIEEADKAVAEQINSLIADKVKSIVGNNNEVNQ